MTRLLRPRSARLLAPEVVQSSAMDCGPAALKCLLEGFGIAASYERLREACQTEVDGTSIDVLEEVACSLGLEAEQVMLPPDHLLLPAADSLPALVVVRNPIGMTHFLVVWRRLGNRVQLMDPASGRHWTRVDLLLEDLYHHSMPVPADAWRAWAGTAELREPLRFRLRRLRVPSAAGEAMLGAAEADATWRGLATLDAAVRWCEELCAAGTVRRGSEAERLLRRLTRRETGDGEQAEEAIPDPHWFVRPLAVEPGKEPLLQLRGAVLLRVRGRRADADLEESRKVLRQRFPDLAAAVDEVPVHPFRALADFLTSRDRRAAAVLASAVLVAALGTIAEVLFFRGFLDLGLRLTTLEQRAVSMGALLLFLVLLIGLEVGFFEGILRLGRRLEVRVRVRYLDKLARLGEQYFHSRLSSDMAERCHNVHRLRLLGEAAGLVLRSGFQLLFLVLGILWIDPLSAPLAIASGVLTLLLPSFAHPVLAERDLRMRNHGGALSRFYLDALLGLVPIRSHGGEGAMAAEHEGLLREWMGSALRLERGVLWLDLTQTFVGYGFAVWMLLRHLHLGSDATQVLLLVYWALSIPMRGQELALLGRQLPQLQSVARRLLEPLAAPDEEPAGLGEGEGRSDDRPVPSPAGAGLVFRNVGVRAGGHRILEGIDLEVCPGTRLAVIGPSGAGKSSLVGLLLGWHRPSAGSVLVDGEPLTRDRVQELRTETAWVDPAVQLWNRSLLANVVYGAPGHGDHGLGFVIDAAELRGLLQSLPGGWRTRLGEGGALVSGGEGQRVRLGRSLLRRDARLVILDEPFRGVDRAARGRLLDVALEWWAGATILCITHDIEDALKFDQLVVMEGGTLVEGGTPSELAADPASRYATWLAESGDSRERFLAATSWRRLGLAGGKLEERREP